jgi:hypothetical protein
MRITAQTALFVTAIIASASAAVAANGKLTDLPTGDVWISEPGSRDSNTGAVPDIPPSIVMPEGQNAAPTEFNFNITLTLRKDRHRGVHAGRPLRHASQLAHRGNALRHKFRPDGCRG